MQPPGRHPTGPDGRRPASLGIIASDGSVRSGRPSVPTAVEVFVRVFEDIGRIFEEGRDLTIGIEEEFQILDGATFAMVNRFADLKEVADEQLGGPLVVGELIQY